MKKENYFELNNIEFNNNFEMQEKFITKLVLDYISDIFVEYARLFRDNARFHQEQGYGGVASFYELTEMAEKAVKNIRGKYEEKK